MRGRHDVICAAERGTACARRLHDNLSQRHSHRRDVQMSASIESDRIIDARDTEALRCDRRRNANGRMHTSIARRPVAATRASSSRRAS
jgi:hypothetical protein